MIESGPIPAVHGVVRWWLIDLAQWIFEEFRITVAKQTLSRELRAMGYRKLSARPRRPRLSARGCAQLVRSNSFSLFSQNTPSTKQKVMPIWILGENRTHHVL